jgi:hypothetical protein
MPADAADFREFTRVRNLVYREIAGNDDDAMTPEELLPHYQPTRTRSVVPGW